MHNHRSPARTGLPTSAALILVLVTAVAACGGAGTPSPSPVPTVRPTATPIGVPVTTPAEAATLVIATNAMFEGAMPLTPDVIGASKWWVATPLAGGGYSIELTVGWGDCQAGCSERHVWTYEVSGDGAVKLISESGDEVPTDLPA